MADREKAIERLLRIADREQSWMENVGIPDASTIGPFLREVADMLRAPWISVKERLPKKRGAYLCYLGHCPFGPFIDIVNYSKKEGAFWWFDGELKATYITHWAPMPEPPEEDDDGK